MAAKLKVDLIVDDNGSVKINKFTDNVNKKFGLSTRSVTNFGIKFAAIAGTAYAVGRAMGVAVNAASDLQETTGKFDVVFEGSEKAAAGFVNTLTEGYLMSTREARYFLASIQDLLVPMGMNKEKAADLSFEVVKLATDLGSFNNLPTAKVMEDIQSGLVGNYETMKKYGVVLKATVVDEKALAMGLADSKKEITANDRALAAYTLIVEGSQAAIGDVTRTQMNYANQTKQFHANTEELLGKMGEKILPGVTSALIELNNAIKWMTDNTDQIVDTYMAISNSIAWVTGIDAVNQLIVAWMSHNSEMERLERQAAKTQVEVAKQFKWGAESVAEDSEEMALEIMDDYEDIEDKATKVAQSVANVQAGQIETMEDTYLDYGQTVYNYEEKLNTSIKDNWDDTGERVKNVLKDLEKQNATSWHNIQANMTREMNLMGDNWETHVGTPAKRTLGSVNEQNLDTLQDMRNDWKRETETIGAQMKKGALDAIGGDLETWKRETWDVFSGDLKSAFGRNIGIMVEDFRTGTVTMEDIGHMASESISEALGSYASKMFTKAFDVLIDLIAVNIGLGAASTGASAAQGGGWVAAAAKMGVYIGAAGAAMVAAKATASDKFSAEGGWISSHPTGGWIMDGDGFRDDVFLGHDNGVNHWGMGGEFVMNKRAAQRHAPLLEAINAGHADGGSMSIGDQLKAIPGTWKETALMLQGGLGASFGHGTLKGGPYVGLAEMAAFAGTGIGGAFLAKAGKGLGGGNLGFADGGPLPGGSHMGHFSIGGWNPIDDIKDTWDDVRDTVGDTWDDATDSLKGSWDHLRGIGGDVWENLKEGKWDQAILDAIDLAHESLVMATPSFMRPLLPDNPVDIIRRLVDPEFLLEMLLESLTGPLRTVSKDLREPGKLWSNPLAGIEDMIRSANTILDATTGIDVKEFLEGIGFAKGTNYVENDGLAYIHQGEKIIPEGKTEGGGGRTLVNNGIITTDEVDRWFTGRLLNVQDRAMGSQYQTVRNDEIGLRL